MSKARKTVSFTLSPEDNHHLGELCGQYDENLRHIERYMGVEINNRGYHFSIIGPDKSAQVAAEVVQLLYEDVKSHHTITTQKVYLLMQNARHEDGPGQSTAHFDEVSVHTKERVIRPRSQNQYRYLKSILQNDINFGIGPSGTGKTYLAVACAVAALEADLVRRIVLVRPAVEAGEKLGFLPGDLEAKVLPYLRPIYDALFEMIGSENMLKLMEKGTIEIAPLAFMRGRSLNDSFIILDESQNTTKEQMKMFLTRIGFGSKAVITGDITQIDLPKDTQSGLRHIITVLKDIEDISFTFFQAVDVVRHPLVQQIIQAYESYDDKPHD